MLVSRSGPLFPSSYTLRLLLLFALALASAALLHSRRRCLAGSTPRLLAAMPVLALLLFYVPFLFNPQTEPWGAVLAINGPCLTSFSVSAQGSCGVDAAPRGICRLVPASPTIVSHLSGPGLDPGPCTTRSGRVFQGHACIPDHSSATRLRRQ